ncbi:MAG: family 65 glycosyl hydrolase [Actinomycetota bacterium]|nr:family 65 glycosyl hydrolase [Actinomycetota bacterium]
MSFADETRYTLATDPWKLSQVGFDASRQGSLESLFALSNGHIGLRGTLDEGEPRRLPGSYLNGLYEERVLPHAEAGYGFPESGQTVVNVADGKLIRLLVGDSPLDLTYGEVLDHHRTLDLRSGILERQTHWRSPNGRSVRVRSQRLVSLTRRSIAAICYEVEPIDDEGDLYVAIQSDLLANEDAGETPVRGGADPRAAARVAPLIGELSGAKETRAVLGHITQRSRLRMAVGMDHELEVPDRSTTAIDVNADVARFTVSARLPAGSKLRLVKYLAYGWSSRRSAHALRDQVEGALATSKLSGWDVLVTEQRKFLDDHWAAADVEIEGDDELQQAVRVAMFHVLQAAIRAERRAIPAKGLTGPGYDGHTFWDTETYVLPVLTYTAPEAARDALIWRHSTLDRARARAAELGQKGAAFPWRTINGAECSGYWPAGTAAFHINADIADAVARYFRATNDRDFDRDYGAEILIETARLWMSLGHFAADGGFRIDGVTGPDEYSAITDDNTFTNLMAQRNLREAAAAAGRQGEVAERLGVDQSETASWHRAADAVVIPYDERLEVHQQSEDFTQHDEWDFANTPTEHYPLLLHAPYFEIYRKQVIKQADLVMAMFLRGDAFSPEQKARNFGYYESRTVRDSSLSAAMQAVLAAEVGHLDLAYDYWAETVFTDLYNLHGNSVQGLHLAALAGAWTVAVCGFGGMRDHNGWVTFAPRLPPKLTFLAFRILVEGRAITVKVNKDSATYHLIDGKEFTSNHHGQEFTIAVDRQVTMPIPVPPKIEPVQQPKGREPIRRD